MSIKTIWSNRVKTHHLDVIMSVNKHNNGGHSMVITVHPDDPVGKWEMFDELSLLFEEIASDGRASERKGDE